MKAQVIFPYKNMVVGGAELLILNLAKTLKEMQNTPVIVYETADIIIKNEMGKLSLNSIECKNLKKEVKHILRKAETAIIICHFFSEYIMWTDLCRRYKNAKVVLYCVHFMGMIFGRPLSGCIRTKYMKEALKLIQYGIAHNNIDLMDYETEKYTVEYYGLKLGMIRVIGIPHDFDESNLQNIKIKSKSKPFKVITVARAEFPFKGYIITLIDKVYELIKNGYDIELNIISYGMDEAKIKEKINTIPNCYRKKIILYGKTSPKKLKELYKNSHIAVGMGTAMLDAAANGVIGIPVVAGTYECLTSGDFFHQNPRFTILPEDGKDVCNDMIKKVYEMEEEQFCLCSYDSFTFSKKHFSTENIVRNLIECETNDYSNIDFLFLRFICMIDKIWKRINQKNK